VERLSSVPPLLCSWSVEAVESEGLSSAPPLSCSWSVEAVKSERLSSMPPLSCSWCVVLVELNLPDQTDCSGTWDTDQQSCCIG